MGDHDLVNPVPFPPGQGESDRGRRTRDDGPDNGPVPNVGEGDGVGGVRWGRHHGNNITQDGGFVNPLVPNVIDELNPNVGIVKLLDPTDGHPAAELTIGRGPKTVVESGVDFGEVHVAADFHNLVPVVVPTGLGFETAFLPLGLGHVPAGGEFDVTGGGGLVCHNGNIITPIPGLSTPLGHFTLTFKFDL